MKTGSYTKLIFFSFCQQNKIYDPLTDYGMKKAPMQLKIIHRHIIAIMLLYAILYYYMLMIIYYYTIYYDFSFSFNTFIGIIIVLLKQMLLIMCQKKKKGKDNKEIVHKCYKLGISGEIL